MKSKRGGSSYKEFEPEGLLWPLVVGSAVTPPGPVLGTCPAMLKDRTHQGLSGLFEGVSLLATFPPNGPPRCVGHIPRGPNNVQWFRR